jgi:hypothetical protein
VQPDPLPFVGGERRRLGAHARRHADVPEVVHECGAPESYDVVVGRAQRRGRGGCELGDATGVTVRPWRLQVDEIGPGFEHGVDLR